MSRFSIRHLLKAGVYGLQGLGHAFRGEHAFRVETAVLVVQIIILVLVRPGLGLSLLVIGAWLGLMMVELLNSSLEACLDLITLERNPLVGKAKDMAAAAVLLGVALNGLLWLYLIFF